MGGCEGVDKARTGDAVRQSPETGEALKTTNFSLFIFNSKPDMLLSFNLAIKNHNYCNHKIT